VIGFLHLTSLELTRENLASFRRGLAETGYSEGKNVAIELPARLPRRLASRYPKVCSPPPTR
jgi:hypothetical protein